MVVESPHFPPRVFDMLKIGNSCIMIPNLTTPPGADIKNVVEDTFDHAAVTDDADRLATVAVQ